MNEDDSSEDSDDSEDTKDSKKDSDETFMKLIKKLYKLQPLAKTDEEFAELEILKIDIRNKFGSSETIVSEAENTKYVRSSVLVDYICRCEYHPVSTWECKPCWNKRISEEQIKWMQVVLKE